MVEIANIPQGRPHGFLSYIAPCNIQFTKFSFCSFFCGLTAGHRKDTWHVVKEKCSFFLFMTRPDLSSITIYLSSGESVYFIVSDIKHNMFLLIFLVSRILSSDGFRLFGTSRQMAVLNDCQTSRGGLLPSPSYVCCRFHNSYSTSLDVILPSFQKSSWIELSPYYFAELWRYLWYEPETCMTISHKHLFCCYRSVLLCVIPNIWWVSELNINMIINFI